MVEEAFSWFIENLIIGATYEAALTSWKDTTPKYRHHRFTGNNLLKIQQALTFICARRDK